VDDSEAVVGSVIALMFWAALGTVFYTYVGYPALIHMLSRFRAANSSLVPTEWPRVSIIIGMHNEEKNVGRKIANLKSLRYPADKLQLLIVSDGSTDTTVDIARQFDGVDVLSYEMQKGKPTALNLAAAKATGEILVFTDARQQLNRDAVRHLVSSLNNPTVGVVSGLLVQDLDEGSPAHSTGGLYWRYEKGIRMAESRFDSVPGASGALYAIRKRDYVPLAATTILDDVELPMNIVRKGLRCILDSRAVAHDVVADHSSEMARKIRTLTGNFQLISNNRWLLSPFENPIFLQFYSHKVLRLFVPYMLLVVAITPFYLGGAYRLAIPVQVVAYTLALLGFSSSRLRSKVLPISIAYVFLALNVAAMRALVRFLGARYTVRWKNA
jgi:biofilm PGA synthesis N-glycosyltransferase PgaC